MRDLHNNMTPRRCISPQYSANNNALVGQIIDRQGYDALEYVILTGNLADSDATFTVLLEESDAANMDGAAPVDDADLLGTEAVAGFTHANDDTVRKLGYVGAKRYTRLTITPASNGSPGCYIGAVALLGHAAQAPTANPPA